MGYEVRFGAFQVTSSGVSSELSYWVRRMEPFFFTFDRDNQLLLCG